MQSSEASALEVANGPLEYIARGHAHSQNGQLLDAASCFENALRLDANLPMAHNNLGWIRESQGEIEAALLCYRQALNLNAKFELALENYASLLSRLGRNAEAQPVWLSLATSRPNDRALLDKVISISLANGDIATAASLAEQHAMITRGSEWSNISANGIPVPDAPFPAPLLSAAKLKHDIEQLSYLLERKVLEADLLPIIRGYQEVLERVELLGDDARAELSNDDRNLIGRAYGRIVYRYPAAKVAKALSQSWDTKAAEEEYLRSALGIVVLDDFLTRDALLSLRHFCATSTIWFTNRYRFGRLGAFFREGFNCPLLTQIAEELRAAFPKVIGEKHRLMQTWGFKYNYTQPAMGAHADFAAVNVNFRLTTEDANKGGGGLVIYDTEAPAEWDFPSYNGMRGSMVDDFLTDHYARSITVPYRANRAVIFNSDLFHTTEPFRFRDGYENRRVNVTMLFGKREDAFR